MVLNVHFQVHDLKYTFLLSVTLTKGYGYLWNLVCCVYTPSTLA